MLRASTSANSSKTKTGAAAARNSMSSNSNRERTHTGGSTSSWIESGGLRERCNTDGSVRSVQSVTMNTAVADNTLLFQQQQAQAETIPLVHTTTATTSMRRSSNSNSNSYSGTRRRKIVDWIQKQRLPVRRSTTSSQSLSTSQSPPLHQQGIPLITGLDRVIFGTQSAAQAIQIAGKQPPRYLWYMISGAACDVIQFTMDVLLHVVFKLEDASLCWAIGFFLSVFFRHTSHRYLVFGDYVGGYRASLLRMYGGYSVIIVLSTLFNILMTKVASVSHYVAWIMTLLWTGIANYFILKKLWSFGGSTTATGAAGTTMAPNTAAASSLMKQ